MTAIMRHFRTVLANEDAMQAASKDAREVIRRVEQELRDKHEEHERKELGAKIISRGGLASQKS